MLYEAICNPFEIEKAEEGKHVLTAKSQPSRPPETVGSRSTIFTQIFSRIQSTTRVIPHRCHKKSIGFLISRLQVFKEIFPYRAEGRGRPGTGVGLSWVQHHGRDGRGSPDGFQHHYICRINVFQRLQGN